MNYEKMQELLELKASDSPQLMYERLKELVESVQKMHLRDIEYGCGFYDDEEWLTHYRNTAKLVGIKLEELWEEL